MIPHAMADYNLCPFLPIRGDFAWLPHQTDMDNTRLCLKTIALTADR